MQVMAQRLADDQIIELINTCVEGDASDLLLTYDDFKILLADRAYGYVATAIKEICPVSSTPD
jgi:hypothetical protein